VARPYADGENGLRICFDTIGYRCVTDGTSFDTIVRTMHIIAL